MSIYRPELFDGGETNYLDGRLLIIGMSGRLDGRGWAVPDNPCGFEGVFGG